MGRKLTRKGLIKKTDAIVSEYIRKRDKKCVVCGSTDQLTNGHLYSRDTYSTRWDITDDGNCHCQCWPCNYRHEFDPGPFTSWYIRKFGIEKYDEISRRRVSKPWKDWEIQEIYDNVKKKLEELNE
jgi:hypothetical protein